MKSIKSMLNTGFLVLLVFMIVQAVVGGNYLYQSKRDLATAVRHNTAASTILAELASNGQALRRFEKEYFIYIEDTAKRDGYSKEWQETYDRIMKILADISADRTHIWTASDRVELEKWHASATAYGAGFDALRNRVRVNEISTTLSANSAISAAKNAFRVYLSGTTELLQRKSAESQQLAATINERFNLIMVLGAALFIAGCILLAILAVRVPRSIQAPINALAEAAETMSKGNLDRQFKLKSPIREFSALTAHLERMRVAQKGLLESLMRRSKAAA